MSIDPAALAELRVTKELEGLVREFEGTFDRAAVEECLRGSIRSLGATQITDYVASIGGRFARERLRAMAQASGKIAKHVPEVLFVCGRDAGRSQMAAAFANHLGGSRISARSAGEHHAASVHPVVADAMREVGIDVSEAFPKPVTDEVVHAADVVVTMGCGENTCPYYPGKTYRDWAVLDPAGRPLPEVRAIRERVREHVTHLLGELRVIETPAN